MNYLSGKKDIVTLAAALAMISSAMPAQALDFFVSDPNTSASWVNKFSYNALFRLKDQSNSLLYFNSGSPDINHDDGNRNFDKGLVSSRFSLRSEFTARRRFQGWSAGVRVSAHAIADPVYNHSNDNNSPRTSNVLGVSHDDFPRETRDLLGRRIDLSDAFLFARFPVPFAKNATLRVGRHSLVLGQTLFFGNNGIAVAQQPVDANEALLVPNSQFKDIALPVYQASTLVQLTNDWALTGYYQFEGRRTRLPASGSYLSTSDLAGAGAAQVFAPNGKYVRGHRNEPSSTGAFGFQITYRQPSYDASLFFAQWNSHTPQFYFANFKNGPRASSDSRGPLLGKLQIIYPKDLKDVGAGFSTNMAGVNLTGEFDYRWDEPLVSDPAIVPINQFDNHTHPAYAVGRSVHVTLGASYVLRPTFLWQGGVILGEGAWNRRTGIQRNAVGALDPNTTLSATALRVVFSPTYFQVLPNVNLSVPIGVGYNPSGRSSVINGFGTGAEHGGDYNVGADFVYKTVWNIGLKYTGYFGDSGPPVVNGALTYDQSLSDRDFFSISLSRSF